MIDPTIECICGRSVKVEGLPEYLDSEDYRPIEIKCKCGEKYQVMLHMYVLGKDKKGKKNA